MNPRFVVGLISGVLLGASGALLATRRTAPAPVLPLISSATSVKAGTRSAFPSPRLPASRLSAASAASEGVPEPVAESRLTRLLRGESEERPTREQMEPYLQENRRSAESLLGAFMVTRDVGLLKEAAEKFPNDPGVQFLVATDSKSTPEERSRALEAFKRAAPDNALGNYLAACDHFKAGRIDEAVKELLQAASKPKMRDFSMEFVQNREEAFLAAGWSLAEAKAEGMMGLVLPYASHLKEVGVQIAELAKQYQQSGDAVSAQNLSRMGLAFGQQVQTQLGPQILLEELVGIAIQRKLLDCLDPSWTFDASGQTVQDRLEELKQRRETIGKSAEQSESLLEQLNERDAITYFDRLKLHGELDAIRWLRNRQSNP